MMRRSKKAVSFVLLLLMLAAIAGCNNTSYEGSAGIIEASELGALLGEADTVVVDARSPEDYQKGHLEGAVNLSPAELSVNEPVPSTIAPKEAVAAVLGSKGISSSSKVYIYDNNGGVNASRVWWVLRAYGHENVKVVNNGETAIVEAGLPLSMDVPEPAAVQYDAKDLDASKIAYIDEVLQAVETGDAKILDVRSRAEYDEGAIPGAIFYPHTKNLYVDGTFKSGRDTFLDYNDLGLEKDDAIIIYCKSSFRAAQTALVLEEAGYGNVKLYDGAWLEWSTKDVPKEEKEDSVIPSGQDAS